MNIDRCLIMILSCLTVEEIRGILEQFALQEYKKGIEEGRSYWMPPEDVLYDKE